MTTNTFITETRTRQIIGLIDLTDLSDNCSESSIETLCAQSTTPTEAVAAICIWPGFIATARQHLGDAPPIKIATVVNFPSGDESLTSVCKGIEQALEDSADEIDYVLPYSSLIAGDIDKVSTSLDTIRKTIPSESVLKVILETGELSTEELIRTASGIAIDHGADFIKTSTGKVPINATIDAALVMLNVISQNNQTVGFKAAGGIKTIIEADRYLTLAEEILGQTWVNAAHFRFGASSLLNDALAHLDNSVDSNQQSQSNQKNPGDDNGY